MLRRYIVTDYPDKNDAGEIGVNAWMKITDTLTATKSRTNARIGTLSRALAINDLRVGRGQFGVSLSPNSAHSAAGLLTVSGLSTASTATGWL